jgi:hypothetical protein
MILLQYFKSLLHLAVYQQDTYYKTFYDMCFTKNIVQSLYINNFCSTVFFISEQYTLQHLQLYLYIHLKDH